MSLESRFWAKVDKNGPIPEHNPELGPCWVWTGGCFRDGYGSIARGNQTGKTVAHRASWEINIGTIPLGMEVDHRCWVRRCVNPIHLRLATSKQNSENIRGAQSNNRSSGIRGVSRIKRNGKWRAYVNHNGKQHYCGTYSTPEQAGIAAAAKRAELFTHSQN